MLYNIKKPFATHHIQLKHHQVYYEEYGNPNGVPVLFLHGGPGSGCNSSQKSFFNHKKFRVIFIDQRGSGKSKPRASTKENTTQLLIMDIEKIRELLDIPSWLIVGGSWGATLAVAYAQKHTSRVKGMILRSLFLGTKEEIDWAFLKAPLKFRPELISNMISVLNMEKVNSPINILGKMLESKDVKERALASELWLEYEGNLSTLSYEGDNIKSIFENKNFTQKRLNSLPNTPFMEWHYIKNNFFLKKNQLIKEKKKLENIPISIVQSNYDLLCPPSTSFIFSQELNKTKIHKINRAGHYISDPGVKEKIKELLDDF